MKAYYDCVPCMIRQALEAVRLVTDDSAIHEQVMRMVLSETAASIDFDETAPYMFQIIHRRIKDMTNCFDPYRVLKDKFNNAALSIYDGLVNIIEESDNPFETAMRIAIAGNVIDCSISISIEEEQVRESIKESLERPILFNTSDELKQAVGQAGKILYLGDNSGEIVFDKLLIKQISPEKITYVVKGEPVLNDVTREDAVSVGMPELVTVIDNGNGAPGTIIKMCSPEFMREYEAADLVISKGQGNYETLSEVTDKDIFFLLKAKCPVIAKDLNCQVGDIIVKKNR
ncbi:MAG: ARMT1-like domain-containing protein [Syntrophomonas sp.]